MKRTITTLGALMVLAFLPTAAYAQGPDPAADGGEGGQEQLIPMETNTVYVVSDIKPGERALSLYRSLIPRGYTMPGKPQIGIYLTEPNIPRKVPGQPYNDYTRWIEGPLAIKVRFGAKEGYFPLVMPVSSKLEYDLGRAVGLPKVNVDGSLEETPVGVNVITTVKGAPAVTLRFRRGPAETSDELASWGRLRLPLYALFPALRGPDLYFTKFTPEPIGPQRGLTPLPAPTVSTEPEPGLVDYEINPDLDALDDTLPDLFKARGASIADLIEPKGTLPGLFQNLPQILHLRSGKIGDGGGYGPSGPLAPGASAPAAPAHQTGRASSLGLPAPRACQSRRRFSVRLRNARGLQVRSARILLNGKLVRSVRGRSLHTRVDLRGLPRGRFRVTVVAITTRGRKVIERRSYRTCAPKRSARRSVHR